MERKLEVRAVSAPGTPRGFGRLSVADQDRAVEMLRAGLSQREVAVEFGVTKNVMVGIWSRYGNPVAREERTLFERVDRLHAAMDEVLAESVGVGRIAGSAELPPRKP
jgi:hypothetical protein